MVCLTSGIARNLLLRVLPPSRHCPIRPCRPRSRVLPRAQAAAASLCSSVGPFSTVREQRGGAALERRSTTGGGGRRRRRCCGGLPRRRRMKEEPPVQELGGGGVAAEVDHGRGGGRWVGLAISLLRPARSSSSPTKGTPTPQARVRPGRHAAVAGPTHADTGTS